MKKVVKVSIGSIAFTLEEEAHSELDIYLNILGAHYKDKEGGDEILEGIEERLAELLMERGYSQKVVTVDAVKEVMSILGNPEEIESESEGDTGGPKDKPKRRLFRDLKNKQLGGVCSGLASYFSLDPTAMRIIVFVLGLVAALSTEGAGLAMMIVLYFALWIIIPGAKTVEQKCQMRGQRASLDSIERKVTDGVNEIAKSDFGVALYKFIRIFVGVFLIMCGIVGLAVNATLIFGLSFMDVLLADYLAIFSGVSPFSSLLTNILLLLVFLLPCVGMLYGGIVLTFNFTSPKWRPGLVNFVLWIVACIALVVSLVCGSSDYWSTERKRDVENIAVVSDTVYIKYHNVEQFKGMQILLDADRNSYHLGYISDDSGISKIVTYPELNIRTADEMGCMIKSECEIFPKTMNLEELQRVSKGRMYHFEGDTLILYPTVYSRDDKMKTADKEVTIYLPSNVTKIVQEPIYHDFSRSMEYTDIKILKNFVFD